MTVAEQRQGLSTAVDGYRLWQNIEALAKHGASPGGAVNRPALSKAEARARAEIVAWGREIGLSAYTDAAANLFLRLEGQRPELPPVLIGSHIDSQPTGGCFDGTFGVIAALEVLRVFIERGERPERPVELVAWTNEEGSRFAPGMSGSTGFTNPQSLPDILAIRDRAGISMAEAIAEIHAGDESIPEHPLGRPVHCYIEPHIEQNDVLERANIPIGIVTGIQGTRRYRIRVDGKAGHAGTVAMADRRDALIAATGLIGELHREAVSLEDMKFTVGQFDVTPNAPSVIPESVYFSLDIRCPDNAAVDRLDAKIRAAASGDRDRCQVSLHQITHAPSLSFPAPMQQLLEKATERAGLASMRLFSAAGHDARQLHYVCPTGMIFVPCCGGISHHPAEWVEPQHILAGTKVLAEAVALAARAEPADLLDDKARAAEG